MSERSLLVKINTTNIGTLHENQGIWSFVYNISWLQNPQRFALSPHLPLQAAPLQDSATLRPVQWYFDNLLPEAGQRSLLARSATLDENDAFAMLARYGAESAGSLTLLNSAAEEPATGSIIKLPDTQLSARIQNLPKVPLAANSPKRMSLAGAQHKLAVVLQNNELYEPEGASVSTHILKPDHPEADYAHSVINEWFVMQLAARLGLVVPAVHRRYVPEPVYLIERYDRRESANHWQRLHAIDACQLLGLSSLYKYDAGSMDKLATLADTCRSSAVARARLYNWLVFNMLTGNSDAHLKNLSFLVSAEGIQVAPHYDLLSTACYDTPAYDKTDWPQATTLAWPVLGKTRFHEIDRSTLLDAGAVLNLNKTTANRLLAVQRDNIVQHANELYEHIEKANDELRASKPHLSQLLIAEAHCLRTIIHSVITPMVQQLR